MVLVPAALRLLRLRKEQSNSTTDGSVAPENSPESGQRPTKYPTALLGPKEGFLIASSIDSAEPSGCKCLFVKILGPRLSNNKRRLEVVFHMSARIKTARSMTQQ